MPTRHKVATRISQSFRASARPELSVVRGRAKERSLVTDASRFVTAAADRVTHLIVMVLVVGLFAGSADRVADLALLRIGGRVAVELVLLV